MSATFRIALAGLLLAGLPAASLAQTISQPVDTSPAVSTGANGQSFTATLTGWVTAIDVKAGGASGPVTLYMYNGGTGSGVVGSAGTPAYTQTGLQVVGSSPGGLYSQLVLSTPFPVVAGNAYTFQVERDPVAPLNLLGSPTDTYAGGTSIGNFGGVAGGIDRAFQVYEATVQADLAITKTDGVASVVAGGSTTYTITASNAGPDGVTGATVNDTFPASLTGVTWTCVGAGGGTCTAGPVPGNINDTVNLPAGGSVTYTVSATISAGASGTLVNTATVTGLSAADSNLANNSATDTDTISQSADLAITKTDGVAIATPGGSVTYTITASNAGPSNASGVTVADTFPASLTATWTCVGAGGGTCTAGPVGGNISDSVNLPVGGSVTYTATATINPAATGSLSNTATVASAVTDPNPANNSATDIDTLTPQADLSITKTDGVTTVVPGGSVTYTIVASNAGPSNATATVADTFPASLLATWTCVGAGGGTCTAGPVAGNINDSVNLPAGGSVTYTVNATLSGAATGTLTNTATVSSGVTDPNPANNAATDVDSISQQADLAITKTDGVASAIPGGTVTYTITAANGGPSPVTGATVADTFPASLTGVSWTCAGAGGGTCTAGPVAGNISDTVNLPAGGSVTYTATATVSASATGTLTNTATVSSAVTDPNPANNSATDIDTLSASADLSITKTDGVASATLGGTVTYTIIASNAGPSDVTGATVADTFPASLTGVSWTCVGAGGGTCTAGPVAGNISDTINLPAGGSVTYTATATVGGTAPGTLTNTATVAAPGGVTDPAPGNNSATDTDTIGANTSYSAPSATGTGTITASFTGGGAGCTFNVAQYIPLTGHARSPPAGSAPTNATFPHGLFDFTTTGCTPASTITMTITYPVALPAGTQYWKYGPTPGNATPHWYTLPATIAGVTATFTITDGQLGDDDLAANGTIVDQGGPGIPGSPGTSTAIPTLSEWMLMLMAALMLATVILRERRRPKDLL